jgi:MFS family permease
MRIQDPELARARRAVTVVFGLHGAGAGTFFTRIPWLRDHLGLSPAMLGLALVFPALGAVLALPLTSRIAHRLGGRAAVRATLLLCFAGLPLVALAPSLPLFCAALLVAGAAAGLSDALMNASGVAVEERLGRSIMSGLHGTWSAGALVASGLGALAARAGVDGRVHFGVAGVVLVVAGALACRRLLGSQPGAPAAAPPRFSLPPRSVLPIGAVAFCAIFAEGSSGGWSGIYLHDVAGASAGVAAASYTAFAATMAAARLAGDLVVRRFGPVATVRGSGVTAVAGGVLVVTARTALPAIAGFALLGIGIAVVVPLAFAAAGRADPAPDRAIAGMGAIMYAASLASPAAVGVLAGATSLPVSFGVVTALAAVLLVRAGVLAAGTSAAPAAARPGPPAAIHPDAA